MISQVAGANGSPIDQLINVNQPTSTPTSQSTLGPDSFLQLLTTEMQNQDPTNPQDPTQSVTQLAQMSQLQYQEQTAKAFQNFQSTFGVMQASSLIGKQATVVTGNGSDNSSTVTGTVTSIAVQNGAPYFTMKDSSGNMITDNNGKPLLFSTQEIVGIA
jgi:flagellar basal-body rod modification protein FlgD